MPLENETTGGATAAEHSLALLLRHHTAALSAISLISLVLGIPLAANMLWNLRVATNASGRGVLRLILLQQRLNLLSVPIICMELLILCYPSEKMPKLFCVSFEGMFGFMLVNRQLSSICIGLGRLFYLFRGSKMAWIKEEGLFQCLYWLSPVISAMVFMMECFDATYHVDDPLMAFYSFCAKTPFPLDIVHESVFLKGFVIGAVVCHYVAILVKQTKIEAGASSVYIVKNNQSVSTRRHQRNVVSALGHFASCIVSVTVTLTILAPPAFMILTSGPSGPPLVCDLVIFSFPSINFFVYPLIETMCTDILRENLLELTCWKSLHFSGDEHITFSLEYQVMNRDEGSQSPSLPHLPP